MPKQSTKHENAVVVVDLVSTGTRKKAGFTLIELLAVIVIIATIAVVAVLVFANKVDEAKVQVNIKNIKTLQKQAQGYLLSVDPMPAVDTDISSSLVTGGFIKEMPTYPLGDGSYKVIMNADSTASVIVPANPPVLSAGMTPVKWNGTSWVTADRTNVNNDWYKYNGDLDNSGDGNKNDGVVTAVDTYGEKWANIQLAEGSQFVWIPRFVYKITSKEHTTSATGGRIKIKYSSGTLDENVGGYRTHPAFKLGNSELTGIWVAKFEASPIGGVDNDSAADKDDKSTKQVQIKPDVSSWRYIRIGNMFNACRNMETDSVYGWGTSGTGVDSHLMKNIEWGAVAYLAEAVRDGEEIWINDYWNGADTKTGMSTKTTAKNASGNGYITINVCAYNKQNDNTTELTGPAYSGGGARASTTGNIYGIYDMSGGSSEYVSAYINNLHSNVTTFGLTMNNAGNAKYVDVYTASPKDISDNWRNGNGVVITQEVKNAEAATLGNYNLMSTRYGDALYETSYNPSWNPLDIPLWWYYGGANTEPGSGGVVSAPLQKGWYKDCSLGGWDDIPFFDRGGDYVGESYAGSFAFNCSYGNPQSDMGFRPVCAVGELE